MQLVECPPSVYEAWGLIPSSHRARNDDIYLGSSSRGVEAGG